MPTPLQPLDHSFEEREVDDRADGIAEDSLAHACKQPQVPLLPVDLGQLGERRAGHGDAALQPGFEGVEGRSDEGDEAAAHHRRDHVGVHGVGLGPLVAVLGAEEVVAHLLDGQPVEAGVGEVPDQGGLQSVL